MTVRLIAHGVTDVGRVRHGNEDGFIVDDRMGLMAVADGMGGHQGGEVASLTALEALRAAVSSGRPIRDAIATANEAVMEKAARDADLHDMGTTLTAGTLASGGTFLIGHVGDSRAYLARNGELRQITEDHSLVEEMVRDGQLTPEQAEIHPYKSTITRAVGLDPDLAVDVYPIELQPGDRVLLCSDGLTNMVRPEAILAILGREPDPAIAAQQLVDAANAAGGEDNITALVIDAVEDDGAALPTVDAAVEADVVDEDLPTAMTDVVQARRPPRRRGRRILRVLAWTLPVVVVLAVAVGALGWYARRTYFVGIEQGRVTIFQGVPGGILGWDPTVEARTNLDPADLTANQRADVTDEKQFSSLDNARSYVRRLRAGVEERTPPSTTLPPTTLPPPSTLAPAPAPT